MHMMDMCSIIGRAYRATAAAGIGETGRALALAAHFAQPFCKLVQQRQPCAMCCAPQVPVLKAAGVAAACVGNHDFDFGINNFR
jgi:hypothetical protein